MADIHQMEQTILEDFVTQVEHQAEMEWYHWKMRLAREDHMAWDELVAGLEGEVLADLNKVILHSDKDLQEEVE